MRPKAIIVTVGSEILLGDILDTNAAWLSRAMVALGIEPVAHHAVGDALEPLAETLKGAMAGVDVVVATGGLGPTADDQTRHAAALATGRPLELREELLEPIRERLASRGRAMSDNNRRQALIPEGALALANPVGTAPGFIIGADGGPMLVCLPGIPFEMERVWRLSVEPVLKSRFPAQGALAVRVLKCVGAGESEIDRLLGEAALGTTTASLAFQLARGEIHVRLMGQGGGEEAAGGALDAFEAEVRARLGRLIYGGDDDTLASVVVGRLRELGCRVATQEGVTAGALSSALAEADTEGIVFLVGRVAGEAALQSSFTKGAQTEPSSGEERALALAEWAALEAGAEVGLAACGELKRGEPEPTATYYLAVAWGERKRSQVVRTSGPMALINRRAALTALDMTRRLLNGWPETGP